MLCSYATFSLLPLLAIAAPLIDSSGDLEPRQASSSGSGQQPFTFPLSNGFPNIQVPSSALTAIQSAAQGTLPNSPLPSKLADASATTFQAIAFGEFFEVAYFSSLLNNITNNISGYEIGSGAVRNAVIEAFTAIVAQEELHALGVNAILQSSGRTPVQPCKYIFPVDDFDSAVSTAAAFTDAVVLGGLQDALNTFATDGDAAVIPLLTSVVGQEGEQNGFYRALEQHIPSALPFLTRSTGPFAYSYINQNFVVPGSCTTNIAIPIFKPLYLQTTEIAPANQQLQFSISNSGRQATSGLSLVYINQQNLPVVEKLSNVQTSGSEVTFSANFPYQENLMNGLTIAVLVRGSGPFSSADAVANSTVFGPAIIEIN